MQRASFLDRFDCLYPLDVRGCGTSMSLFGLWACVAAPKPPNDMAIEFEVRKISVPPFRSALECLAFVVQELPCDDG